MRVTQMFGNTLREVPKGTKTAWQRLALRSGLARTLAPGVYAYLPLGHRVLQRLGETVRSEWQAIGGQEAVLPLVQPLTLWERSGRDDGRRTNMARFRDQSNRELAVGMRHDEAVAEMARSEVSSHHQLPVFLFEEGHRISLGDQRRAALLDLVAYHTFQGYSLQADEAGLAAFYTRLCDALGTIFARCGLETLRLRAGVGNRGGDTAHRWVVPHGEGGDAFVRCTDCDYAATLPAAVMAEPVAEEDEELPVTEVATPGTETIAALAGFLDVPASRTLKVVFYTVRGQVVCVAIRGDRTVDEGKLASVLGRSDFYASTESELAAVGAVAGYGSPIGMQGGRVIADRTVAAARNLVAGANRAGYHVLNVNTPRDFQIDTVADLAAVEEGDLCVDCGCALTLEAGIELARAEMSGTALCEALEVTYLDAQGKPRPLSLASCGLGLDRLLAAIVESHHDEQGIVWPLDVAPYQVYLLGLNLNKPDVADQAETLYHDLKSRGYVVLYDDRDASAGVKFNDADLIGLPLRVTISSRSLKQGGFEAKWRNRAERQVLDLAGLHSELRRFTDRDD